MRRTLLFLPGNNPNMIVNGGVFEADSIILDLEDAVASNQKDAARNLIRRALESVDFGGCDILVRINGLDTELWEKDLEAVVPLRPYGIIPVKVSETEDIKLVDQKLSAIEKANGINSGEIKIIALLETARGIENAYGIARASGRMEGLLLGAEDLTADLCCERTKGGKEIDYARYRVVNAARAAGIAGYDCPFTDVDDMEGLERDAVYAKSLGFSGKASVNPRHIACINEVFSPTEKEILYARRVFDMIQLAKEQGKGAISLDGKMIDAPIVQRAKNVLDAAEQLGVLKNYE